MIVMRKNSFSMFLSDNDMKVYDDDEREKIPPRRKSSQFLIILFVLFMPNLKRSNESREKKSHKSPEY